MQSLNPGARRQTWRLVTALAAMATAATLAQAQNAPSPPSSLAKASRPEPSNLGEFVANKAAAIALGKALFWDARLGSDGKTACASCHFSAGADTRSKNQLSPGPNNSQFAFGGPNYQFKASDFPLHQFADPDDRNSAVVRSLSIVASSQGVFREQHSNIVKGQAEDARQVVYDPVFHVGTSNTRRVEPRNTPSVINAVFNLRNFWDGRAQTIFNGVNPFGKRDTGAKVYRSSLPWNPLNLPSLAYPTSITLNDSSLASQASGPPLSDLEMSAAGRAFPELGRKMYSLRPLAGQPVAADDSVLASWRHRSGDGLAPASYADMVRTAFKPVWWNATVPVRMNGQSYQQVEANFSLFFSLSLQLYQATLVSDQTPFDKYLEGNSAALTVEQQQGFGVFMSKGKCINCHGGPALTNASIHRKLFTGRMSNMPMGNGANAVYDEGFYNIGVTRTSDDLGVGGRDPFGNPLSYSGLAKEKGAFFFLYEQDFANVTVTPWTRIAVNGAFKTPGLRNVALTAPYFHNGGAATLEQVVEFYNRGGNFALHNIADLDADIQPLGLTASEKASLVAFMKALTDDRVRRHAAPFDHPQLIVTNGHPGDTSSTSSDSYGRALDSTLLVPAVGRNGYAANAIPAPFLGLK
jgi:cytochrome c peroxidase